MVHYEVTGVYHIIDISKIPLANALVNPDCLFAYDAADKPVDAHIGSLPGAVHAEKPQNPDRQMMRERVRFAQMLAGKLGNAVRGTGIQINTFIRG